MAVPDSRLVDFDNHYYEPEDAFTRHGDDEVRRFAALARGAGALLNVIDKPEISDFTFGAVVSWISPCRPVVAGHLGGAQLGVHLPRRARQDVAGL